MNSIFEVYASRKYFPPIPSRNFMAFVTEFLHSTMTITQNLCWLFIKSFQLQLSIKTNAYQQIETAANNAIPLAWNCVCLQQKQYGRQVKSTHGQLENNAASTPVLYPPWFI